MENFTEVFAWMDFFRLLLILAFLGLIILALVIRKQRQELLSWQRDVLTGLLSRRQFSEFFRLRFMSVYSQLFRTPEKRRQHD